MELQKKMVRPGTIVCEQNVKEIFMDKLELENDIIVRAHRAKKVNMARRMNLEQ